MKDFECYHILIKILADKIRKMNLKQVQAANLLGISQSRISLMMNGDSNVYNCFKILTFLNALGMDVDITVRPAKNKIPRITVAEE